MFSRPSPQWTSGLRRVVVGAILVVASPAAAGKRVVVLDFAGPDGPATRTSITRILRAEHQIVPRRQIALEADKLGIVPRCDPGLIPGLASVLGAEGVVCGTRRGRGLRLTVYNGGDGQSVATIRVPVGRGGMGQATRARTARQLSAALGKTWSWAAVEVQQTAPVQRTAPAPAPLAERTVAAAPPEPRAWENEDGENPLAEPSRPATRREATPAAVARSAPTTAPRGIGAHAVKLSVGPSMLLRRNYAVYDALTPRDGQGWTTTPVAGFAVAAELFPAAWLTRGWATNIGLGLSYTRFFGLTWRTAGAPEQTAATHQVFSGDVRGRYPVAIGRRTLVIGAHAGYRRLSFAMNDTQPRAVIPDVAFSSLDLGLNAQITVLPDWLDASARFAYLPVLGRGEIVTGEEYGPGSGGGMVFGGGLGGKLWGPVGWSLELEYTRYVVVFDGDPSSVRHASKARDRYLSSVLMLTYVN